MANNGEIYDLIGRDAYSILGVPEDASQDAIAKAYRKLAFELHPDRNPTGVTEFKRVQQAWEAVGDRYDRMLYNGYLEETAPGPATEPGKTGDDPYQFVGGDAYDILGVPEDASQATIDAAYRKLRQTPYSGDDAMDQIRRNTAAYDAVKNPDARAEYDAYRQQFHGNSSPAPQAAADSAAQRPSLTPEEVSARSILSEAIRSDMEAGTDTHTREALKQLAGNNDLSSQQVIDIISSQAEVLEKSSAANPQAEAVRQYMSAVQEKVTPESITAFRQKSAEGVHIGGDMSISGPMEFGLANRVLSDAIQQDSAGGTDTHVRKAIQDLAVNPAISPEVIKAAIDRHAALLECDPSVVGGGEAASKYVSAASRNPASIERIVAYREKQNAKTAAAAAMAADSASPLSGITDPAPPRMGDDLGGLGGSRPRFANGRGGNRTGELPDVDFDGMNTSGRGSRRASPIPPTGMSYSDTSVPADVIPPVAGDFMRSGPAAGDVVINPSMDGTPLARSNPGFENPDAGRVFGAAGAAVRVNDMLHNGAQPVDGVALSLDTTSILSSGRFSHTTGFLGQATGILSQAERGYEQDGWTGFGIEGSKGTLNTVVAQELFSPGSTLRGLQATPGIIGRGGELLRSPGELRIIATEGMTTLRTGATWSNLAPKVRGLASMNTLSGGASFAGQMGLINSFAGAASDGIDVLAGQRENNLENATGTAMDAVTNADPLKAITLGHVSVEGGVRRGLGAVGWVEDDGQSMAEARRETIERYANEQTRFRPGVIEGEFAVRDAGDPNKPQLANFKNLAGVKGLVADRLPGGKIDGHSIEYEFDKIDFTKPDNMQKYNLGLDIALTEQMNIMEDNKSIGPRTVQMTEKQAGVMNSRWMTLVSLPVGVMNWLRRDNIKPTIDIANRYDAAEGNVNQLEAAKGEYGVFEQQVLAHNKAKDDNLTRVLEAAWSEPDASPHRPLAERKVSQLTPQERNKIDTLLAGANLDKQMLGGAADTGIKTTSHATAAGKGRLNEQGSAIV